MPKPKKEIMKAKRDERRARGLVRVDSYVKRDQRQRLARYVEDTLGGETNVRRVKTGQA